MVTMVQYFHFRSPDANFDAPLQWEQCAFVKTDGHRCRRHVLIGTPMCFQHRKKAEHVEVKTSNVPNAGKGVFATNGTNNHNQVFHSHQTILDYDGAFFDEAYIDAHYGDNTAPYGVKIQQNRFEDAALHRGIGSLLNQPNNRQQINAEMFRSPGTKDKPYPHIRIRAIRPIYNRDELYLDYGNDYRMHEPDVYFGTSPRKGFHPHH